MSALKLGQTKNLGRRIIWAFPNIPTSSPAPLVFLMWCKKDKRKRVVIYSESDGEDESDDEWPGAKT